MSSQGSVTAPIRVLEITQAQGGGVQKYVLQLCRHLDRTKFAVTGCCSAAAQEESGDLPFTAGFEEAGVGCFTAPMVRAVNPLKDLLAFIALYREIRRRRFDVVHAHSSKAGVLARAAARLAGVPAVLYSPHAFAFAAPGHSVGKAAFVLFEKIAARFCDALIADSRGERSLALDRGICPPDMIRVIPPGVAVEQYATAGPGHLARELGVPEGNKVITFVGRLALQKDPLTFLRGARALAASHARLTFLVAGDGPLRERCAEYVQREMPQGAVKLLGWRRDYASILALSDMVVISSTYEGLPFILLEAMACGKAVVATDIAGNREVVVQGENGFLVPPAAPELLARACGELLTHPDTAARAGAAARRTVAERFTVATTIALTEETYTCLVATKRSHHG